MKSVVYMTTAALAYLMGTASAHMEMVDPPPFRSKHNPNSPPNSVDYSMTAPLDPSGSNFPCKGYQSDFGTEAGKSVVTWKAGQQTSLTIGGNANHGGGSCQASLSYDKGKTFKVIHSWIGGCPGQGETKWDFSIPKDAPSGEAIFAWTWFNRIGNREMYMNCAAVTVEGGGKGLDDYPEIYTANINNGKKTKEGEDPQFPEPGKFVNGNSGGGNEGGNESGNNNQKKPSEAPTKTGDSSNPDKGGVFVSTSVPQPTDSPKEPADDKYKEPADDKYKEPADDKSKKPADDKPKKPADDKPKKPADDKSAGDEGGETGGEQKPGSPCDNEGYWNCVGGNKFQRCASGQWSQLMSMSDGMECKPGMGDSFVMNRRSARFVKMLL